MPSIYDEGTVVSETEGVALVKKEPNVLGEYQEYIKQKGEKQQDLKESLVQKMSEEAEDGMSTIIC